VSYKVWLLKKLVLVKIFEILYYYYYSFYLKVDDEPHSMTVFALSFSEALLINFLAQMILVHFYCYLISTWQMICVFALLLIGNYFLFIRSGFSRKIVKLQPPIIFNKTFTIGFVILFFIITISFLILVPILTKSMLENCR
jgi:hypothetical protein